MKSDDHQGLQITASQKEKTQSPVSAGTLWVQSIGGVVGSPKKANKEISLSTFFPEGTEYFYSYPVGENSGHFNSGHPATEEMIATRALVCAGADVKAIVFASAIEPHIWQIFDELGLDVAEKENIIPLPENITHEICGEERNNLVKASLRKTATLGKVVMAQPFLDPELRNLYQIPPQLSVWLNDKINMPEYIPRKFLSERYACFPDGLSFASCTSVFPIPCVVKVTSSCSGDGVRICKTMKELEQAKTEYKNILGSILVEEFIDADRNFGIQFGIPFDRSQQIEIIGVSEQLTTDEGEFIGGIIDPEHLFAEIDGVNKALLEEVLPAVREMGWYGVGGFDVLIDSRGKFYMEDPNFRMTAMTPFLCEVRSGKIKRGMVSFSAVFRGTRLDFARKIMPIAQEGDPHQVVHIIALTEHSGLYRMNAAMLYDKEDSLQEIALKLMEVGIESQALKLLSTHGKKFPDFPSA